MRKETFEDVLLTLLNNSRMQEFTVSEIHALYLESHQGDTRNEKTLRQLIYRNMLKLQELGMLKQKTNTAGKAKVFQIVRNEPLKEYPTHKDLETKSDNFTVTLKQKLGQYRLEFLNTIGEMEVLKELTQLSESPTELLSKRYEQSKEQSSKLLGKVRMLEDLLSES